MTSKIKIIAVGKIKEGYIREGTSEFMKRLSSLADVEIIELKDEGIKKDSEKIVKYLGSNSFIMDAAGKSMSSEEFSDSIKKSEQALTFIIGGPEGITDDVKKKSKLISLSKMTFTHEMARLFLVEQIYRAFMIISNRSYYNK
jgi:23S rRNA (pseudouridine1915-N3)-methyltransferase